MPLHTWRFVPRTRERRFHAYCVGAPKSGTHSIGTVFHRYYAAHEPKPRDLILHILRKESGRMTPEECRAYVERRDRSLRLEMESNNNLVFFLEHVVRAFPSSPFLMTIRDCYSSIDSRINHDLARRAAKWRPIKSYWQALWDLKFLREGSTYEPGDEVMERHGLYPLRGYLSAWARHNQKVLDTVPAERLLVIRTGEIRKRLPEIAQFVGAEPEMLDARRSHSYRVKRRYNFLEQLDPQFLEQTVERYCRPLMDRFFPEIRNLSEAMKSRA